MVKNRAKQRSAILRAVFQSIQQYWRAEELCFVDESGANERTGYRKRGWSPRSVDCSVLRELKRSERWSILPAVTVNGYLPGTLVIQGSVTKDIFIWWLKHRVLPQLKSGSILVMDNASIHHNMGLEAELLARNVSIEYLPPYSPDFNPIEQTFHTLKEWLRKHNSEAAAFPTYGEFLVRAVECAIGDNCRAYFKSCGYNID